jgi:pimeloyl-ACP methyl ester carboxylesterase
MSAQKKRTMLRTEVLAVVTTCVMLLSCGSFPQVAVKERYFDSVSTGMPLEAKFTGLGGELVSFRTYPGRQKQRPNYKIWYPSSLEGGNKPYPVVLMVNGTGVPFQRFEPVFEHLASWGFVVAGNDDEWSALGTSTSQQLDFLLALNDDRTSPFYRKLDPDHIGIAGHSQGGAGAIHAVTDFPNGSRYRAMYTASAVSLSMIEAWKIDRTWVYDTSKIRIPYLMVAATGDVDAKTIAPLSSLQQNFRKIGGGQLTIMARRKDVDHGNTLDHADGYMTAWFRYQLLNDQEAQRVFVGLSAEIVRNTVNWQDVEIKGQVR